MSSEKPQPRISLDGIPPPANRREFVRAAKAHFALCTSLGLTPGLPDAWARVVEREIQRPLSHFWWVQRRVRIGVMLGLTDPGTHEPRRGRRLTLAAAVATGLASAAAFGWSHIEQSRIADRQAVEREYMARHGPELLQRAAHHTLAFGVPNAAHGRIEFSHEGVIVERDGDRGTHFIATVRHPVASKTERETGRFTSQPTKPLFMLPMVGTADDPTVETVFGADAIAPKEVRGYVDPKQVYVPVDDRIDAMGFPLAAVHGYKNLLAQLNADITISGYRLKVDRRDPVEGDPVFVMALDTEAPPQTSAAKKLCDGSEAIGIATATLSDPVLQRTFKLKPAVAAQYARDIGRGIADMCDPPYRRLRMYHGYIANQAEQRARFPDYANGDRPGIFIGGFTSLPGESGMAVFSVEDGKLRWRGTVKQGETLRGGVTVMDDARTIYDNLITPQREAINTAVNGAQ